MLKFKLTFEERVWDAAKEVDADVSDGLVEFARVKEVAHQLSEVSGLNVALLLLLHLLVLKKALS